VLKNVKRNGEVKMKKYYYAGHSYMGTNYTYDCQCWTAYAFESKKERDEWMDENEYKNGNRVAEVIDRKTAYKIAGIKKYYVANIGYNNQLEAVPN
jgi:hypothetical protein